MEIFKRKNRFYKNRWKLTLWCLFRIEITTKKLPPVSDRCIMQHIIILVPWRKNKKKSTNFNYLLTIQGGSFTFFSLKRYTSFVIWVQMVPSVVQPLTSTPTKICIDIFETNFALTSVSCLAQLYPDYVI